MPFSRRPCANASRTRRSAAAPFIRSRRFTLGERVVQSFGFGGPGGIELPAVLRFQAQAERLLELAHWRGDTLPGKLREKARCDHRTHAGGADSALGDVAAMQP